MNKNSRNTRAKKEQQFQYSGVVTKWQRCNPASCRFRLHVIDRVLGICIINPTSKNL
jgi:hypothetical protein